MKPAILFFICCVICGCANGSPIDLFIPTKRPSPAYDEYMGHLYPTNGFKANKMYHSLVDTKLEKALVDVRKMELEGLRYAAKGETELIERIGTSLSNGIWAGITAILTATGIMLPRPAEKGKIAVAGNMEPSEFKQKFKS